MSVTEPLGFRAAGPAAATVRTTDLSAAYVHENSAYST
jgi:N-acetylglutamate synthase/N-acetylornithine aminotransferase